MSKIMLVILSITALLTGLIFMKTNTTLSPQHADHFTFGSFTTISLDDGFLELPLAHIIKDDTNFDHPLFYAQPEATQKLRSMFF